jgi:regulation of enolase protein 1 (concanavalin A-like superfamily)
MPSGGESEGDAKTGRNPDGTVWKNPFRGWDNFPSKRPEERGVEIEMRIPPNTDCWRKTRNNSIRDSAPFHWHKVTGDFDASCKVSGELTEMYDRAGMMIRVDEVNWIMTGLELFNDQMNHSTLLTKDHTDWSLTPLPTNSEKVGIWFKISRRGESFQSFYSTDRKNWILTREGIFTAEPTLMVGICGSSPIGKGFKGWWEFYQLKNV